jgi:hypothetical protein
MLMLGGLKLKTMIDRTMRSTFLSLNRTLPVLVPRQTNTIQAGDNAMPRPASLAQPPEVGDDWNAAGPVIDPDASHAGEEIQQPSAGEEIPQTSAGEDIPQPSAGDVFRTSEDSPLPKLMEMLGELIDGDTLADLVAVMGELEEREARALIAAMRERIECRLTDEGMRKKAAASHARQLAQRIRDAWSTLHRPKDHARS